jgi:hypothetical protein
MGSVGMIYDLYLIKGGSGIQMSVGEVNSKAVS